MQPTNAVPGIIQPDLSKNFPTQDEETPLHFWEIPEFFQCPVVGMCLTLADQKQVLKKTKISPKNISPFEIHEAVVASSACENRVSRRVDRLLQRKFGKQATSLFELDESEFFNHYRSADAAGDHAAAVWATAAHPTLPLTIKREIFGEIHMSMHFSGEERLKMKRKLSCREDELKDLRCSHKKIAQQKRTFEKEIQDLKQSQNSLKNALRVAEKELTQSKKSHVNNDVLVYAVGSEGERLFLRRELEGLYECNRRQQRQIEALAEKNRTLASKLGCQCELNRRIRQETRTIISELIAKTRCDQSCPSFDLCQKRILIVGGMSRMETLYRELIEASGGIFEYHDGYMKKGSRQLESRLRRADMVLCPVNCNSHNACSAVKRLAKKHQKPVQMLANSSLQAISRAIWGAGNSQHIIN